MLRRVDLFSHGDHGQQSLSFLFGIVFLVNEAPMNVVDDNPRGCQSCRDLDHQILGSFPLFSDCVDVLF